ncbi:MAG: septum formation initiator family protein [Flavobacteriaceae bacterium]|nr:septum formation initiator family protein [Flavobacteriaceae bacterium]
MTLKQFRHHKLVKIISNKYLLILFVFIVWMLFFDENSYLTHRDLNKEKAKLEKSIKYYSKEIEKDKKTINQLRDSNQLEKYGRETYFFKRDSEDVYIIEFDTVNK